MKKILFSESHKNRFIKEVINNTYTEAYDDYLIAECYVELNNNIEDIMDTVNLIMFNEAIDIGPKLKDTLERIGKWAMNVVKFIVGSLSKLTHYITGKKAQSIKSDPKTVEKVEEMVKSYLEHNPPKDTQETKDKPKVDKEYIKTCLNHFLSKDDIAKITETYVTDKQLLFPNVFKNAGVLAVGFDTVILTVEHIMQMLSGLKNKKDKNVAEEIAKLVVSTHAIFKKDCIDNHKMGMSEDILEELDTVTPKDLNKHAISFSKLTPNNPKFKDNWLKWTAEEVKPIYVEFIWNILSDPKFIDNLINVNSASYTGEISNTLMVPNFDKMYDGLSGDVRKLVDHMTATMNELSPTVSYGMSEDSIREHGYLTINSLNIITLIYSFFGNNVNVFTRSFYQYNNSLKSVICSLYSGIIKTIREKYDIIIFEGGK